MEPEISLLENLSKKLHPYNIVVVVAANDRFINL